MIDNPEKPKSISIATGDEMSRGRYSNNLIVSHSPEEFILDWLLNSPGGSHLVARIIVSPAHIKRIIAALTDNLQKYETLYGRIREIKSGEQKFH